MKKSVCFGIGIFVFVTGVVSADLNRNLIFNGESDIGDDVQFKFVVYEISVSELDVNEDNFVEFRANKK